MTLSLKLGIDVYIVEFLTVHSFYFIFSIKCFNQVQWLMFWTLRWDIQNKCIFYTVLQISDGKEAVVLL